MNFRILVHLSLAGLLLAGTLQAKNKKPDNNHHFDRQRMVSWQVADRGIKDKAVLQAMRTVPRHQLVPTNLIPHAYEDRPLPIGHGQTISQPYIVGLMTELLELEADDTVLEVGTGSGYQAAILAQIVKQVISLEIVGPLATRARSKMEQLGYKNLKILHADGYFGYKSEAPFDAIIVTAAAEHIPPPLLKQLKPGGKMIIPVGRQGWTQNLVLVKKDESGHTKSKKVLPVRFVPLTRTKR